MSDKKALLPVKGATHEKVKIKGIKLKASLKDLTSEMLEFALKNMDFSKLSKWRPKLSSQSDSSPSLLSSDAAETMNLEQPIDRQELSSKIYALRMEKDDLAAVKLWREHGAEMSFEYFCSIDPRHEIEVAEARHEYNAGKRVR